jgi:hypothetical protein
MNQEIKQQWIDAALSGAYEQAKYHLHMYYNGAADRTVLPEDAIKEFRLKPCFCIQGILCDIAAKAGVVVKRYEYSEGGHIIVGYGSDGHTGGLPREVMQWAAIDPDRFGSSNLDSGKLGHIAVENDSGVPFSELVPIIQRLF